MVPTASGPVARIALGGCEIVWLRLDDGSQVEAPDRSPARRGCLDGYDEWTAVNGLSALIEGPGATFDSEGQVTGVEDVAALQITRDGEVVAEIPIGGFYEAYARIHDFDGRFVIVSRGPFEPAMPAESYFVIDLETGEVRYPGVHEGASGSLLGPDVDAVPALPEVPYVHRGTPMFSDDRISHLEDGTYVGYVTYAAHEGLTGRPEIHFDLAVWLVGKEADYAALEDGEESPRPNDYYIRNEDSLELVLPVAPDVGVTSVWFHYDQSNSIESRPITWQQFVDAMTGEPSGSETAMVHDPWWVTLVDGQVVAIDEQYIP